MILNEKKKKQKNKIITTSLSLDKYIIFLVFCAVLESNNKLLWCLDNLKSRSQGNQEILQEQFNVVF